MRNVIKILGMNCIGTEIFGIAKGFTLKVSNGHYPSYAHAQTFFFQCNTTAALTQQEDCTADGDLLFTFSSNVVLELFRKSI